jgi:hypothetical protein
MMNKIVSEQSDEHQSGKSNKDKILRIAHFFSESQLSHAINKTNFNFIHKINNLFETASKPHR